MNRRGFLAGIIAAAAAPAIVRASSLMPIVVPRPVAFRLPMGFVHPFMGEHTIENRIMTDSGWMLCDGRVLSRSLYPELFKALAPVGFVKDGDLFLPIF